MKALFEELVKKGYQVHNKRVLGDPKHTSEETKTKDAIQELALAVEWIRVNFGIHIWIASKDVDGKDVLYIGNARNIPVKKDKKGFIIDPLPYNPKSTPQEATEAALLYTLQNLIL